MKIGVFLFTPSVVEGFYIACPHVILNASKGSRLWGGDWIPVFTGMTLKNRGLFVYPER